MIKVSVIIPTYGYPNFLEKAIISVLNQTLFNFELLIIDDNNPNSIKRLETQMIVSQFLTRDKRIKYIQHDCNKNGAVARNTGLAVAKGKYISFLDSDDEYMTDRLQKCFDAMESAPDTVAGVYTGCEFRRNGKAYFTYTNLKDGNYIVETLACKFMFCTGSNIFVRKNVVDELNGFDGTFLRHQDYEFLVRMFEKYSLISIPNVLVIKNNENINRPNPEKLFDIKKQYLDKFKYIINKLPEKDVNYIMHGNYIDVAECFMAQKKYKKANIFYRKASTFGGLSSREWFRRIVYPVYNIIKFS